MISSSVKHVTFHLVIAVTISHKFTRSHPPGKVGEFERGQGNVSRIEKLGKCVRSLPEFLQQMSDFTALSSLAHCHI